MSPPRSIVGSPGRRIKVILGETGSDYLIYCDHDDGDREWQTVNWPTRSGGPFNSFSIGPLPPHHKGSELVDWSSSFKNCMYKYIVWSTSSLFEFVY